MLIHSRIGEVTERIARRSPPRRDAYRERIECALGAFRAVAGPAEMGAGIISFGSAA